MDLRQTVQPVRGDFGVMSLWGVDIPYTVTNCVFSESWKRKDSKESKSAL